MGQSLEDYMSEVPWERKERFTELLYTIRAWFPESKLSMMYKMPTFVQGGNWISIANRKNYVSVYTCSLELIEPYLKKHPETKHGKGCLNFRDKDEIDYNELRKVVEKTMKAK
jgi:uncharacterized protein YdhG (YjbR/CyaY superfamily)